jgi:hypothetical protein
MYRRTAAGTSAAMSAESAGLRRASFQAIKAALINPSETLRNE